MAIVLPRQKGALAGLSEALGPLLQKIQADNAREKQARELSSVVNFLQAPQSANVPIPQVGGQAGNVLSQGLFQRQQFGQQQGLQKQNQQAAMAQAIAIQNARNTKTPLELEQEGANLAKTRAETDKLGKTKPGTLKDRLGQKVSEGTATEQEEAVFDQLSKTSSTNITVGDGKRTTNSLALNKTFKSDERIKDIRTIEKFTQNMVTAFDRSTKPGFKSFGPTDITLAKSFQKLTDLGSTVREGEFATTFEGQSLINKVRGKMQSVISGGLGFTPEDRKELVDLALALQEDSRKLYNKAIAETSATSDELDLNTRAVLGGVKPFEFNTEEDTGTQQSQVQPQQGGVLPSASERRGGVLTGRSPEEEAEMQELLRLQGAGQ